MSPDTPEFTNYLRFFLRTELRMHLMTIAFFSLAFKSTSSLYLADNLSNGHAVLGKSVIRFQQVRGQV